MGIGGTLIILLVIFGISTLDKEGRFGAIVMLI